MRPTIAVVLFAALNVVQVGCATHGEAGGDSGAPTTSDGALLTLVDDESGPIWRDWKPGTGSRSRPEALGSSLRAFDYWEIGDAGMIDEIWSALFPVLDGMRARSESEGRRKSVQLLLEAIEPGRGSRSTRMDVTFLVSSRESEPREGFACRLYRRLPEASVTPAVTILFFRDPRDASSPGRIWIWGAPGFAETEALTATYRREGDDWKGVVVSGLAYRQLGEGAKWTSSRSGRLAARVLTDALWNRFAGDAYLESPQSGAESDRSRPEGIARALGLEMRARTVDQVYSGTEFPPRADLEDL